MYHVCHHIHHYNIIAEQNTPAESNCNYLLLRSSVIEVPSSSAETINDALTKHRLQNFMISNNRLKILELLGAGEEHLQSLHI